MLDSFFGLPAHPLIVHAAVVLLPLAAIGIIVVAVMPKARRHYAPLVFGFALAATVAVGLAGSSGEALQKHVQRTELVRHHTQQAETVLPWSIAILALSAVLVLVDRFPDRIPKFNARQVNVALAVLTIVAAIGGTWAVTAVGHSGAKASWSATIGN